MHGCEETLKDSVYTALPSVPTPKALTAWHKVSSVDPEHWASRPLDTRVTHFTKPKSGGLASGSPRGKYIGQLSMYVASKHVLNLAKFPAHTPERQSKRGLTSSDCMVSAAPRAAPRRRRAAVTLLPGSHFRKAQPLLSRESPTLSASQP